MYRVQQSRGPQSAGLPRELIDGTQTTGYGSFCLDQSSEELVLDFRTRCSSSLCLLPLRVPVRVSCSSRFCSLSSLLEGGMSSPHRPSPYRPATPPLGQHQSQYQDWSTTALNGLQGPPASVQSHFAGYSQAQPVAPAPYNAPYPYQHHQPSARHDPPSRWHPSTAEGSATHGSVPPPNALSQGLYAAPTSFPVHSVPHPQASMYPGSYEAANSWALRPEASLTDYQGTGTWGGGVDASGELYQSE